MSAHIMASEKVYKSNISGIRILRYRVRTPKDGEDENAIPCIYLLVWNSTRCGTESFSSFFEAWSAVQVIDREQLAAMISLDDKKSLARPLEFPQHRSLEETLYALGIDEGLEVEYDFDAVVEEFKAEIANALKASIESPVAADGIEPETPLTARKTFKL